MIRRYHEQYQWPLAPAILLLLAEMFLPERQTVQSPKSKVQSRSSGGCSVHCDFCFYRLPQTLRQRSALRDYQSGNYTNALQEYERLAEIQTNDLRLVFNAGAAAYRATNFDEALQEFPVGDAVAGFEIAAAGVLQSGQHALPDGRVEIHAGCGWLGRDDGNVDERRCNVTRTRRN